MKIELGLSETDIAIIHKLVCIANINCRHYEEKEDKEGLSDSETEDYGDWILRFELFNRIEALAYNEITKIKKDYTKYLMPKAIYKDVLVHEGLIEIAGHTYRCDELIKYDQQGITVREFEDEFVLHEKTGKYIASIKKMHPEVNQDALDEYISLRKKYLEMEKKKMNINLSILGTIS